MPIWGRSGADAEDKAATDPGVQSEKELRRLADEQRKAEERAAKKQERAEKQDAKAAERAEREAHRREVAFTSSPAGQARESYARGDRLFQVNLEIRQISGDVVHMMGTLHDARDVRNTSDLLNSIIAEGWKLHSFSTAFVQHGEVSRDKFLSSGQQVAVRGALVGTYVFLRE